jgi:hypothetical protein
MRCGERWFPVRVLGRRGYRLPYQWWRCPNECNAPGTEPYEWRSDFAPDRAETTSTSPVGTTSTTTSTTPVRTTSTADLLPRVKCSGEVLSFADLQ